jgi:uncharacterized protein
MNNMIMPILLISLLVTGCGSSPPVRFYTLASIAPEKQIRQATGQQPNVGIGPISAPVMLDNKKIMTRLPGNTVQFSDFQQWASPLPDNFLQILTQNLNAQLPLYIFRPYPWSVHGTVDRQIIVDIIRFDASPGVTANLEANWTLKNEQTNAIIRQGHTILSQQLSDSSYPGMVSALSHLLAQFSRELSSVLQQNI